MLLLSTVACDQASKSWARSSLTRSSAQAFGNHVQLILAENRGAFLSLGSHLRPHLQMVLFTLFVGLAVIGGVIWLFVPTRPFADVFCVSLIVGGGIGNLIDRVSRSGAVTDFIYVWYGPLRTGIFNLADVFITTGVLALLLMLSLRRHRARRKYESHRV